MEFHNTNTSLEKKSYETFIYINEKKEKKKSVFPTLIIKGCGKTSFMWKSY